MKLLAPTAAILLGLFLLVASAKAAVYFDGAWFSLGRPAGAYVLLAVIFGVTGGGAMFFGFWFVFRQAAP
jgi:hypothetical protein